MTKLVYNVEVTKGNQNQTSNAEIEEKAYDTAIVAAIKASQQVLKYWPNSSNPHFDQQLVMEIFNKSQGVGNYATIADIQSEEIIINLIQQEPLLKGHHIVAEETKGVQAESEYQWIIDPIDGTPPFKNGLPEFGVSIGLLKKHEPLIGVIAMPALGQIVAARKHFGVSLLSLQGEILKQIKPPQNNLDLDMMLLGFDLPYTERAKQVTKIILKLVDKVGYCVSYGSCSTGNFRLAQGYLGAYLSASPTLFDIGASTLIIQELGGIVTDLKGEQLNWATNSRSYLASLSPQIHKQILAILNNS